MLTFVIFMSTLCVKTLNNNLIEYKSILEQEKSLIEEKISCIDVLLQDYPKKAQIINLPQVEFNNHQTPEIIKVGESEKFDFETRMSSSKKQYPSLKLSNAENRDVILSYVADVCKQRQESEELTAYTLTKYLEQEYGVTLDTGPKKQYAAIVLGKMMSASSLFLIKDYRIKSPISGYKVNVYQLAQ